MIFFSTKKSKKSSKDNVYFQLFATDKEFGHAAPMKYKNEANLDTKQLVQNIGSPDTTLMDAAREEKSKEEYQFLNSAKTTLRVLEEGNPWARRSELHIVIFKDLV